MGSGSKPSSVKTPLALNLKVFDRATVGSPDPASFGTTYEGNGLTGVSIKGPTPVVVGGGTANQYTILVPAGHSYLVIGQATVGSTPVYVGSPTDSLAQGSTTQKYLQAIQNGNGKVQPATTTAVPGTLLLIAEPDRKSVV